MAIRRLGEPLALIPFTKLVEKQLYYLLIECGTVKVSDPKVQSVLEKEVERATMEWYEFSRIHGREPDEEFCLECLERFKREQLPIIRQSAFDMKQTDFVDTFLENVKNHTLLVRERFSEEDYQFILASERYHAERYYNEHSVVEVGYEDLDIRTSQKAQVKGLHELLQAFEQRFDSLYRAYEKGVS